MKWHSWWSASAPEERHICRNRPSKFPAPAERHMQCKLEVEQPGTTGFSHESNQIKLNQTSVKIHPAISRAPTARPHTSPGQRPWFVPGTPSALKGRPSFPIKAPSRQKPLQSCLIKANQGKRQIRIWSSVWPTHPLDRADWQAKGQGVCQGKILSLGRGYR